MPSADSYEALIQQAKQQTPQEPQTLREVPDRLRPNTPSDKLQHEQALAEATLHHSQREIVPGPTRGPGTDYSKVARQRSLEAHPLWNQRVAENTVLGLAAFPMLSDKQAKAAAEVLTSWSIDDPDLTSIIEQDFAEAMAAAASTGNFEGPAAQLFGEALGIVQEVSAAQIALERQERLNRIYAQAKTPLEISAAVTASSPAEVDNHLSSRLLAMGKASILDSVTMGLFDAAGATAVATAKARANVQLAEGEKLEIRRTQHARVSPTFAAASLVNLMVANGTNRREATTQVLAAMDELSEEEKSVLQRNIANFTADEIIEQAEAEGDPFQNEIDRQFQEFSVQLTNTVALWDGVAQALFVEATSLLNEIVDSVPGLRDLLGVEGPEVDRPTLVQHLIDGDLDQAKGAWDELVSEGAGGWYGMEGAGKAWTNIMAGVFFDPLNVFTLGGAAVAGDVATALARNPEQIIKHPGFRAILRHAVEAGPDNALAVTLLGDGLSTSAKARILSTKNPEEITEILLDEMINGHYVPDPSYMTQRRHTALGLGKAAANLKNNRVTRFLVDFLKRSRYGRTINTGEAHVTQEIEELVLYRYGADQEAAANTLSGWYDLANEQEFGRIALRTEAMERTAGLETELAELEEIKNSNVAEVPWIRDKFVEPPDEIDMVQFTEEAIAESQRLVESAEGKLGETLSAMADRQSQLDGALAFELDDAVPVGEFVENADESEIFQRLERLVQEFEASGHPSAGNGIWFHGSGVGELDPNPAFRSDIGFFTSDDYEYASYYLGHDPSKSKLFIMFGPAKDETVDIRRFLSTTDDAAIAERNAVRDNIVAWLDEAKSQPLTEEAVEHLSIIEQVVEMWDDIWARHQPNLDIGAADNILRKVAYAMADFANGAYRRRIPIPEGEGFTPAGTPIAPGIHPDIDITYEHWQAPPGAHEMFWGRLFPGKKALITDEGWTTMIWRDPPEEILNSADLGDEFEAIHTALTVPNYINSLERRKAFEANQLGELQNILTHQEEAHKMWLERKEQAQQLLEEQRRLLEELDRPKDRKWVYDYIDQFYNDWAEEIGVPKLPNGEFDWNLIKTGESGKRVGGQTPPDRLDAIAIDEDHKRILEGAGALNAGSNYSLPVSPYHMTLWANTPKGDRHRLIEVFKELGSGTGKTLHFLNRIFAAAVLLNPVTPIKSAMDEVLRFGQEAAGVRGFMNALETTFRSNVDNPRAVAHSREVVNPLTHTTQRWETIAKGQPGHAVAAERWLNGTLRQDPIVREVARAIQSGDVQGFIRWWDEIGSGGEKRMVAISLTPGEPPTPVALTGQMVYDAVVASLDELAAEASPTWRSSVIGYLADNEPIPMAIARQTGPVPTQETLSTGVGAKAFDLLYGRPSQRRASLFFDHRFQYLKEIYETRFDGRFAEDNLHLLVDEGIARDLDHARQIFEQRHPQVDEFFQSRGVTTRGYSEEVAAESAGRWADDMMYTLGGVSRGGRAAQLLVPFGPAQFDFYSWWARELSRYTTFALPFSGLAGKARAKMPGHLGEVLGKYANARATAPIPLNLRLLSRATHFPVSAARDDDPNKFELEPTDILQTLTFLPVRWDPDNFLLDFGPGLGPLPNWLIGMLPPDNKFRETLETFLPAVEFIEGQSVDPRRYFLPSSSRSLPGVFQMLTRAATAADGGDGIITDMFSKLSSGLLAQESRPYGFTDYYKSQLGRKLMDDPYWDPGLDIEGVNSLINDALAESAGEEAGDRLAGLFGWRPQFGADGLNPELYYGMVSDLEFLEEFGVIGTAQADELRELKERLTVEGVGDKEMVRFFAESARELLFDLEDEWQDYIVARHPEVAVNMVSSLQCTTDDRGNTVGPDQYCRPDGTVNFSVMPPGLEGDRLRREGTEKGWWGPRPEVDIAMDVAERVGSARRRLINTIYETATGTQWPGADRISDKVARTRYQFTPFHLEVLKLAGVEAWNGMTGAELAASVQAARDTLPSPPTLMGSDSPLDRFMLRSPDLGPIRDWIQEVEKSARRAGYDSPYDWPDEAREDVRRVYAEAAMLDPELEYYYNREAKRFFGPLDFEQVEPPPVNELDVFWTARPSQVTVVDADTVRLITERGDLRVRIIGINAPEQGQRGYLESKDSLTQLLRQAKEITIGLYRPELFGTTQVVTPEGEKRLIAWLYVDGVPLYDPSNFTATNPQGIDIGGDPLDLLDLLRQRQEGNNGELAPTG